MTETEYIIITPSPEALAVIRAASASPIANPPTVCPFLVVATEYGTIVGATPCDTIEEAQESAEWQYNAHKYHTQGLVTLMAYNDDEGEYLPTDWPDPDDAP